MSYFRGISPQKPLPLRCIITLVPPIPSPRVPVPVPVPCVLTPCTCARSWDCPRNGMLPVRQPYLKALNKQRSYHRSDISTTHRLLAKSLVTSAKYLPRKRAFQDFLSKPSLAISSPSPGLRLASVSLLFSATIHQRPYSSNRRLGIMAAPDRDVLPDTYAISVATVYMTRLMIF